MPLNTIRISVPCVLAVSLLIVVSRFASFYTAGLNCWLLCINEDHIEILRVTTAQLKAVDKTDPPCRSDPCSYLLLSDLRRQSAFNMHYSTGIFGLPVRAVDAILWIRLFSAFHTPSQSCCMADL